MIYNQKSLKNPNLPDLRPLAYYAFMPSSFITLIDNVSKEGAFGDSKGKKIAAYTTAVGCEALRALMYGMPLKGLEHLVKWML